MDRDKFFSNFDYLNAPYDEDLYTSTTNISDLIKIPSTTKKPEPKKVIKKQTPIVNPNKGRTVSSPTVNVFREAKALDTKITQSKAPSYEDLLQFHKLSKKIEDNL